MPNKQNFATMNLDEFAASGLLQEINRRLLHPMGLALYVTKDDSGKVVSIGGVIDSREDPAGMVFPELGGDHLLRYQNVQRELDRRMAIRQSQLGFSLQPIPGMDGEGDEGPPESQKNLEIAIE